MLAMHFNAQNNIMNWTLLFWAKNGYLIVLLEFNVMIFLSASFYSQHLLQLSIQNATISLNHSQLNLHQTFIIISIMNASLF